MYKVKCQQCARVQDERVIWIKIIACKRLKVCTCLRVETRSPHLLGEGGRSPLLLAFIPADTGEGEVC